jgi:hypothetical protein
MVSSLTPRCRAISSNETHGSVFIRVPAQSARMSAAADYCGSVRQPQARLPRIRATQRCHDEQLAGASCPECRVSQFSAGPCFHPAHGASQAPCRQDARSDRAHLTLACPLAAALAMLDSTITRSSVRTGNGRCNAVRNELLGHLPSWAGFRSNAQNMAVPLLNQGRLLILRETGIGSSGGQRDHRVSPAGSGSPGRYNATQARKQRCRPSAPYPQD